MINHNMDLLLCDICHNKKDIDQIYCDRCFRKYTVSIEELEAHKMKKIEISMKGMEELRKEIMKLHIKNYQLIRLVKEINEIHEMLDDIIKE